MIEGGGIKQNWWEALGYDLTVISTRSGATGIRRCSGKNDRCRRRRLEEFARAVIAAEPAAHTPIVL